MARRQSITLVTPPGVEPVNVSEAKAWTRIDDTVDEPIIYQLITAARMAAEEYLRRTLVSTSYRLTVDLLPSALGNALSEGVHDLPMMALYDNLPTTMALPKGPVSAITSVTTYNQSNTASVYPAANYRLDAAGDRLILNAGASWPSGIRPQAGCEIVYVAGYGAPAAVPQPIKTGMLIHVASLYEQRGLCDQAMDLPPGTRQLYNQYRILGDRFG